MKYLLLLVIMINFQLAYSQEDSIDAATEFMLEQFKWDIESTERGTMMYLDLPFEYNSKTEYITLSVAKDSGKATPEFISVIFPDIVDTLNGFFIGFTFTVKDTSVVGWTIKTDRSASILMRYGKHKDDYYVTRFVGGIGKTKEGQIRNCFESMMNHTTAVFMFWCGSKKDRKSIMLPLLSFRKQYNELR